MVATLPISHFKAGDVIFREGEAPDAVYVIVSGKVTLTKAGIPLATLEREGIFGDMALIDKAPRSATATATDDTECYVIDTARSATATATDDTECYVIDTARFARLMNDVDPVLRAIFKILTARLRMMTQMVTLC